MAVRYLHQGLAAMTALDTAAICDLLARGPVLPLSAEPPRGCPHPPRQGPPCRARATTDQGVTMLKGCLGAIITGLLVGAVVIGWMLAFYFGTEKP